MSTDLSLGGCRKPPEKMHTMGEMHRQGGRFDLDVVGNYEKCKTVRGGYVWILLK